MVLVLVSVFPPSTTEDDRNTDNFHDDCQSAIVKVTCAVQYYSFTSLLKQHICLQVYFVVAAINVNHLLMQMCILKQANSLTSFSTVVVDQLNFMEKARMVGTDTITHNVCVCTCTVDRQIGRCSNVIYAFTTVLLAIYGIDHHPRTKSYPQPVHEITK